MIKFIKNIFSTDKDRVKGAVVSGKLEGQTKECYIPFSKDSGNAPVIATEQFALPRGGCDLTTPLTLSKINNANKLQLSMAITGSGCDFAPMDLSSASQYLQIGGREFNTNSYRGIGFGHTWTTTQASPVFVGMQETNSAGTTRGDFIVATRSSLDASSPVVRFRVASSGQILGEKEYTPNTDYSLTTKKYVDDAVKGGGKDGSVTAKDVSCTVVPYCNGVDVQDVLLELEARLRTLENAQKPQHEKLIVDLFANGEIGGAYDFNDLSTLYQDVNGTIPATKVGQKVLKVLDISGNGLHLSQSDDFAPTLGWDSKTNSYYLNFNGKQSLFNKAVDLSTTKCVSVFANISRDTSESIRQVYFCSGSTNFSLYSKEDATFGFSAMGYDSIVVKSPPPPSVNILSACSDLDSKKLTMRLDGVQASDVDIVKTTSFPESESLTIGSVFTKGVLGGMNGKMYGLIILGRKATEDEVSDVEELFSKRSGVSLDAYSLNTTE